MNFSIQGHRVHDYAHLIARWKRVCRAARLTIAKYGEADGFELFYVRSPGLGDGQAADGVYLSAGIHGDEPAGTEGLLLWAELHRSVLRDMPLWMFPCLNPWGLVHNQRADGGGRDLNRCYHLDEPAQIREHRALLVGHRFRLALCLHEDYDAQGAYLYEVKGRRTALGSELLASAGYHVPVDVRKTIEGRRAFHGVIMRRANLKLFPLMSEAIFLALSHSERTVTVETPSEYDITARVQAQIAVIQRGIEMTAVPLP